MDQKVSPKQSLFLLRLLTQQEGFFVGKTKPELSPAERKQLVDSGLINVDQRKETPKSRAANYAILTEKGWNWAEKNLDGPLPISGTAGLIVLNKLLYIVQANINAGKISLAGFLTVPDQSKSTAELVETSREESSSSDIPSAETFLDMNDAVRNLEAAASSAAGASSASGELGESGELSDDLKRRLYKACFQITGDGVYGARIRLADLRSRLADVPRPELDNALRDLERTEAASIMPLDDPREILPVDEEAALANSQGKERHILYLSNPR